MTLKAMEKEVMTGGKNQITLQDLNVSLIYGISELHVILF